MPQNQGSGRHSATPNARPQSRANKYVGPSDIQARRLRDRKTIHMRSPTPGGRKLTRILPSIGRSNVTLRSRLLDRIGELKTEIKEIEHRITKRHRELKRWESMPRQTSKQRLLFVEQLNDENEDLERKLQRYDGQVVNVAFFIASADEQLKRAQGRLAEVKKVKRMLESRDKKAAHTIEVVHRFMPTSEEMELREVNETVYSCNSLEKSVAKVRDQLRRAQESLELMNGECDHLQREVYRRNLSSIPRNVYESLRDDDEVQKEQILRLKGSVSVYINALESDRTRMAAVCMRGTLSAEASDVEEARRLGKEREDLENEKKELKKLIQQRLKKLNRKKNWLDKMRRAAGEEDIQALASEAAEKTRKVELASALGRRIAKKKKKIRRNTGSKIL